MKKIMIAACVGLVACKKEAVDKPKIDTTKALYFYVKEVKHNGEEINTNTVKVGKY